MFRSQKEFLEQHVLRRREEEERRLSYWTDTSNYYDRVLKSADR